MSTQVSPTHPGTSRREDRKGSLDKRLSVLFWALLLTLAGAIWLFPAEQVPDGTWLIGIGLILLSLNAVRRLNDIPIHILATLLGALALAVGLAALVGLDLPFISLTLIAIGVSIILEIFAARKD